MRHPLTHCVVSSILLLWWIFARQALPGIFFVRRYRFSNPDRRPASDSSSQSKMSMPVTLAIGGPCRLQAISFSMFIGLPHATASTRPSGKFLTHPVTPSLSASWRMDSRNHTPCTRPEISRCRQGIRYFTFMPGVAPLSGERM